MEHYISTTKVEPNQGHTRTYYYLHKADGMSGVYKQVLARLDLDESVYRITTTIVRVRTVLSQEGVYVI